MRRRTGGEQLHLSDVGEDACGRVLIWLGLPEDDARQQREDDSHDRRALRDGDAQRRGERQREETRTVSQPPMPTKIKRPCMMIRRYESTISKAYMLGE